MKRICIVRINYYPDEPHLKRDAEALVAAGYEVDVICLKREGQKSRELMAGVNVYRMRLEHHRGGAFRYIYEYTAFFTMALWCLTYLSFTKRYTAIQVINLPDFLVFTAVVPKILGAKVALNFFELMPEVFADKFGITLEHPLAKIFLMMEKVSAGFADNIIAANGVLQQERLEKNGVPSRKNYSILNVPDDEVFYPRPHTEEKNTFRLITHGSILERYGLQYLINAVSLAAKEIPGLELEIVGEGEYKPELERLTVSLGLARLVRFTGRLPLEEMLDHIARADVGVVSLLPQNQPQMPCKLFEYLAMDKPVVCSLLPAVTAYFSSNAVIYYDPQDAAELSRHLVELYHNTINRSNLAAAGAVEYKQYCWGRQKQQYLQIFEQMDRRRENRELVKTTKTGLTGGG